MKSPQILISAAAACLLTTLLAPAAAAQDAPISGAADGWAAFTKCSALADDKARHSCFDNVSRAAGLLPPAAETSHRKSFGLQPAAPRATEQARQNDEQVEVTLATVDKGGDGKLTLTTTDGAVWRQVESDTIRDLPKAGQKMKIEKASLGSFLCSPAKWLAFRCLRIR